MLFDSHCHLTAEAFDPDRDEVVSRAREAGVDRLVTIASTPDDAERGLELARRFEGIWTTAGVHPHEADSATPASLARVRELLREPEVVAVGECGLDYHYDHSPRAQQRSALEAQVEMAADTELPLVIHSRSCDEDMIAILRSLPPRVGGVLHCFTGSDSLLDVALERGLYISFTGIVTFSSYDAAHQVRAVPKDRLMIETDSPYLAPVPRRGKRNEPSFVPYVRDAVAAMREETPEVVEAYTDENARRFYGVA